MKEYKVFDFGPLAANPIDRTLNELAVKGWKLIAVVQRDDGYSNSIRHYMERELNAPKA